MNATIFDIETGPLPIETLIEHMPKFEAPANLKDPDKIKAAIEAKKQEWLDGAALSATTGRVLAFGYMTTDFFIICPEDEVVLLKMVWEFVDNYISAGRKLAGFNIFQFDLPFLTRRSWALGVPIPRIIGGWTGRYWNWSEDIIDLRPIWQLGDRQAHGSLDDISKFFGLAGKSGSGKDFAELWAKDRDKAIEYLKNDLLLTQELYRRMKP